ncbi:MAG TPA: sigma-70 family RNA polymerase sigma factor [Polyangiaceae bacterium]|jgi:RNA polymerase sigma factor (sigma-70 family)|nr:sigma-70 family RNA polymerase sigma factor [Polyangiaceae bacterium]
MASPEARPAPAKQTLADDPLGLLTRLDQGRAELLRLALLDPLTGSALDAIAAELDKGDVLIGSVVDEPELTPEDARQRFDVLRAGLDRLHREHGHAWPFAGVARVARSGAPNALESALRASAEAAVSVRLQWDTVERLLKASWIGRVRARDTAGLPGELVARVRRLEREVASSIDGLVVKYQGLVAKVARQYQGMGLSREDLMQDGSLGLLRGIEKFDLRRGKPFGSYAVWWVRQGVRHALATQARTIRLPVQQLANRYAIGRAARRLAHTLGREPSEQELAEATGMSAQSISELLRASTEPVSLETPRSSESESTIGDVIADTDMKSPNEHASARESLLELRTLLDELSPREQHVLTLRFGLDGEDERTLEEIGRSLELTRERVRQICAEALDKLNRATRSRGLDL